MWNSCTSALPKTCTWKQYDWNKIKKQRKNSSRENENRKITATTKKMVKLWLWPTIPPPAGRSVLPEEVKELSNKPDIHLSSINYPIHKQQNFNSQAIEFDCPSVNIIINAYALHMKMFSNNRAYSKSSFIYVSNLTTLNTLKLLFTAITMVYSKLCFLKSCCKIT